jgi:hypothetical protein
MRRVQQFSRLAATRAFFGKGWDNASLDVTYRAVLKGETANKALGAMLAAKCDSRSLHGLGEVAQVIRRDTSRKNEIRLYLPPDLADAHRLLKAYSLTAFPILDDRGQHLKAEIEGEELPYFADPDDDFAKIVIPNLEQVELLAQELLKTLNWEPTPRGAASFLEALYRGAEIPDYVFEQPKHIERLHD